MHRTKNKQNLNSTPYGDNFDRANNYDYLILFFYGVPIIISLFTYLSNLKNLEASQFSYRSLFFLQVILAVLAVFIRSEQGNELAEAYTKKRKCELDYAFDTKFSPSVVNDGYFDIGALTPGFKRLLAITHENAFFTYKNSSTYQKIIGYVTILFTILLILFIVIGIHLNNFSLVLLNFIISSLYLDRLLSSKKLTRECALITDECISVIESWDEKTSYARVVNVFVSYSNLLSSTKVNISPLIHQKFIKENNEEWNKVLSRYYSNNRTEQ